MGNLFDYVAWRGDLSLAAVPLNDIDALLFARLSYIPFEGVVPAGFEGGKPLPEAARQVLAKGVLDAEGGQNAEDKRLLQLLAEAPRYERLMLCGFESTLNREIEEQFAALTIRLPLGACVAYRGTDGTLVGWKEDFNMAFSGVVPAQLHAVDYLTRAASAPGTLRLCGHSKGGNLAVYAAACCPESIQSRIVAVRNFDGPGFQAEIAARPAFQRIVGRTRTFLPRSSVVGMLLEHEEPYTVVESQGNGIYQHNLYLWEMCRDGFVELQQVSDGSQIIDKTVKDWLASMEPDQREQVINGLYAALEATQADTVREVREKGKMAARRALLDLDENTRRLTLSALRLFYQSFMRALPESPLKGLEEKLGGLLQIGREENREKENGDG
ncbi:MAG: DUF2974 domain-containing protein [Clostridia bacterium]|nr:DUF2974 domain-containing protein [Clostridia bacterium]